MEHALELTNVTKKYEGFTLDNVTLTLPRGCIMGLIGENGAGKSTTIHLILDLIRRDGGSIRVLGRDNDNLGEAKEQIGVVLDESYFPDNLATRDIRRIMSNIYRTWEDKTFLSYCQRFALPENKIIKDYSRGMKMKLTIAAALSHDPQLLILDEATSGLDPIIRDEMLDVFLEFIQDEGHSIFMSSHILSDLQKACDYITFIHRGKIVFSQTKDSLLENYGILKCSLTDLQSIDPSAIIGVHKNSFGAEALVLREKVGRRFVVDPASIEDIMLYYIKEKAL